MLEVVDAPVVEKGLRVVQEVPRALAVLDSMGNWRWKLGWGELDATAALSQGGAELRCG